MNVMGQTALNFEGNEFSTANLKCVLVRLHTYLHGFKMVFTDIS